MAESQSEEDPKALVEAASKAFEQEFERFAGLALDSALPPGTLSGLSLDRAESEARDLAELRTRHLGKKSALAASKKMIGRVAAEQRRAFGQLVQRNESEI